MSHIVALEPHTQSASLTLKPADCHHSGLREGTVSQLSIGRVCMAAMYDEILVPFKTCSNFKTHISANALSCMD